MIKKILVANRGEIAVRIIRACREMGIKTVGIYSKADVNSIHVTLADENICIGDNNLKSSYLNIQNIISSAKITNSQAIHPGYGFLSENSEFSKKCEEENILFIGASEQNILEMGDKANAIKTVKALNIPVIKSFSNLSEQNIFDRANELGYPLIIKASAGGGGRGMRIVNDENTLLHNFKNSKLEAKNAFGKEDVYIEKYINNPRHVEVQIMSDKYGNVIPLGDRDCTIQRKYQKLLEETPSTFIDDIIRNKLYECACKIAKSINYVGLGTVEFLLDDSKNFYFIEMNTRIQVEHTITEESFGIDLVKQQIELAIGKKLETKNYIQNKHSIQCRINAEDSENNFFPSVGKIERLHIPNGFGIRVDTHIYQGYDIPPFYDSLLAKLIVTADTRIEAINKMKSALDEFIIEGVKTTIPFHKKIMYNKNFILGKNYNQTNEI